MRVFRVLFKLVKLSKTQKIYITDSRFIPPSLSFSLSLFPFQSLCFLLHCITYFLSLLLTHLALVGVGCHFFLLPFLLLLAMMTTTTKKRTTTRATAATELPLFHFV